ncbi:MAG: tannase [Stomatobaculum sp.]|nr:tannase [Stomatobaculum sp.]
MSGIAAAGLIISAALLFSACGGSSTGNTAAGSTAAESTAAGNAAAGTGAVTSAAAETEAKEKSLRTEVIDGLPMVDMTKWQYNAEDDVYWQVGIPYCASPADESYETMGIFVPGAYFEGTENGAGTYTCEKLPVAECGKYVADTAPMILPVNTPGYSAMASPTGYESSFGYGSVTDYTKEGMVVVFAGCRGREHGAPLGVTDLKAAVRFVRYNSELLPGDAESIFCCGMSGGGAQSAILGASGDSALYEPYLRQIGAAMDYSDAVQGVMCWCPVTNLDMADEAYEWNMGMTREGLTEEEQRLSDGMAEAFADYINRLELTDGEGEALRLEKSETGIWQAGSYADYMKGVVETSLNHFLADTSFPYDADSSKNAGPGGFGGDNIRRSSSVSAAVSISGTCETAEDYIAALNSPFTWVSYDAGTGTVSITSMADFCRAMKPVSKGLGAFDALDRGQGENTLFGYGSGEGSHFDPVLAELCAGTEHEDDFRKDLEQKDAAGSTVKTRVDMYNPLYYLCSFYDGYGTSEPAGYWRIRSGIEQGDTALTTETNLALAVAAYGPGHDVDFETVWGQGHTMAERTGESTENFISWVNKCMSSAD